MIVLVVLLWIFLIIIGLILFLFLLLALPIRYDIRATNIGDATTLVKVRYLFGLVRLGYESKDGKERSYFKIAWKDLLKGKSIRKTPEQSQPHTPDDGVDSSTNKPQPEEKAESMSLSGYIKTAKKAKEVLTSRRGKTIMKLCIDALKKLWKILRPYKFKLSGVVGLGDPGSTGVFFGLYSVFTAFFRIEKNVSLAGDFQTDEVRIEYKLALCGMISILRVSGLLVGLAMKKPMRELIRGYFAKGTA